MQNKKYIKIISGILIILTIFSFSVVFSAYESVYVWSNQSEPITKQTSAKPNINEQTKTTTGTEKSDDLKLESGGAVLIEQHSGQVLYDHNMHEKLRPASVTKVMSILLIMEAIDRGQISFNDKVPCTEDAAAMGGSQIWLDVREELTVDEMLKAICVVSANDCTVAMANYLCGSQEAFVEKMNARAKELGMKNTIFRNSHGLDEETKNYSSAKDMAILSSYANTLPVYKEISKTKKWTVQSDKKSYVWNNRNKLLYSYKYATGGKTGYTPKAGRTLVTTASKDNLNLTIVTLNDANEYQTHESLYEYCFNKYKNFLIVDKDNFDIDDNFYKGNLYIKKSFSYPLTKEEESLVNIVIKLDKLDNYKNNDQVGSVIVNLKDKKIFETEVYVKKDKNKKENLLKRIIKFLKKTI